MWRERVVRQTGRPVTFRTFREFVEAYPPEGLHTTVDVLLGICKSAGDAEAFDLLSRVSVGKVGAPAGNGNASKTNVDNISICLDGNKPNLGKKEGGTSAAYTNRRLAKNDPVLHAEVVAGKLSGNAAAVQAGLRTKYLQVPDDPARAAAWFEGHKDADWMDEFFAAFTWAAK